MTSVVQPVPPPAFQNPHAQQAPAMNRSDSMATADMHIPGAWVGTNPGTPAPIGDDVQYLGEQLRQLPTTVQGYFPSKEATSQTISDLKDKTAAAIPASVMNTAANVLPSSLQPTAAPTTADAQPSVPPSADGNPAITTTTNTVEHKSPDIQNDADMSTTSSTFKDKAAALLPAGALSAAAAYLPSALNPTASPTAADAQPSSTTAQPEGQAPADVEATKEGASESTWTEKILPAGTLAAAGAYLPTALNPFGKSEEPAPTPSGTHEGLNNPLPPIPTQTQTGPLMGSTLSPDEDVQEALSNAADPDQYKVEVVPPANGPDDNDITSRDQSIIESTRAIGGTTPLSPTPKPEPTTTNQDHKVAKGLGALGVGAAGALAVDHGLKDQKEAAEVGGQNAGANGSRLLETNDSFQHVVTPATPFAEDAVITGTGNTGTSGTMSKLDTNKKHRKDRSGSVSAGEASPSSPSKTGMFSGIRKLTKKRTKGHSRDTSIDDNAGAGAGAGAGAAVVPPPEHENSLDTQNSNSTGSGGGSPTKRERNVLHKDPPVHHDHQNEPTTYENEVTNANAGGATPSMLANPFSPISPSASSPTKVGFKDKIKGELMSVSGTITRDHGLKEAGEKLKKGTL